MFKKRKRRRSGEQPPRLDLYLRDYRSLTEDGELTKLSEDQLSELLNKELNGKKRRSFVTRIHNALITQRTRREREEYMRRCIEGPK